MTVHPDGMRLAAVKPWTTCHVPVLQSTMPEVILLSTAPCAQLDDVKAIGKKHSRSSGQVRVST